MVNELLNGSFVFLAGIRGVGMWELDTLNYTSSDPAIQAQTRAMWDALATFKG